MLKAGGYAIAVDPDAKGGTLFERDTITCKHCQRIVFTKPGSASTVYLFPQRQGPDKEEPGAFCRVCMSPICLACCAVGTCTPWERRMEKIEARDRMLRSVGL